MAVGDLVRIQKTITKLWDETGVIDGVRQHGKSYFVRRDVGGASGLRNRRHKKRREKSEPTEGAFAIGGDIGTEVSIAAVNKLNKKFNEIRRDVMEIERQQPEIMDYPSRNTRSQRYRSI